MTDDNDRVVKTPPSGASPAFREHEVPSAISGTVSSLPVGEAA